MDKVTKDVWLALDEDVGFSEHQSFEEAAAKAKRYVVHETTGTWSNPGIFLVFHNPEYQIEPFNTAGDKLGGITQNGWRLAAWRIRSRDYCRTEVVMTVVTPEGSSEERAFGSGRSGLIAALGYFRSACSDTGGKAEIASLKAEVARLKLRLSEIALLAV